MSLNKSGTFKLVAALGLLALAAVFFIKLSPTREALDDKSYFFDLNERKLFVAPRSSIPPVAGIKHADQAGVRAIVISTNGKAADKKHLRIAYLEKYSPELKRVFEAVQQARAEGKSAEGLIDRSQVPAGTLVRRPDDMQWYSLNSAEGAKIVTEWNIPGPDGVTPTVCSP
jgi:hypothetical protein